MLLAISGEGLGRHRSLSDILALVRGSGVAWIELWPLNLEGGDRDLPGWEDRYEGRDLDKARRLLTAYGVGVACVTTPGGRSVSQEEFLQGLRGGIEAAASLGAKVVNTYPHFVPDRDSDIAPLVEVLHPAALYAQEHAVTLVLENEAHDVTATPDGMLRIVEEVGLESFKTNFDVANYYQAGEEGFPYAYERLKKHIGYIHLKGICVYDSERHAEYGRGGAMEGRWHGRSVFYPPLPQSAVNVEGLVSQLLTDGYYDEFVTLEPHVPPGVLGSYYNAEIPYLRRMGVH